MRALVLLVGLAVLGCGSESGEDKQSLSTFDSGTGADFGEVCTPACDAGCPAFQDPACRQYEQLKGQFAVTCGTASGGSQPTCILPYACAPAGTEADAGPGVLPEELCIAMGGACTFDAGGGFYCYPE